MKINLEKFKNKKTLPDEETIHIPKIFTLPSIRDVQTSTVAPLFSINSHVSITPDTSQRGYMGNRIQGRVSAINTSQDGITFSYDIYKTMEGRVRRGVQEAALEYSLGFSANDSCEVIAGPRDGGENARLQFIVLGVPPMSNIQGFGQ